MSKLKIFVSSVQKEFAYERKAIAELIGSDPLLHKHFTPVLFENFPATGLPAQDTISDAIKSADVFILLIGQEYGFADRGGISPTQREYDLARLLNKPCLIFIKGTQRLSRDPKAQSFVHKIQSDGLIYRRFSALANLREQLASALVQLLDSFDMRDSPRQERELIKSPSGSAAAVFIVHGRDEKVLYQVARFLERLVPKVIILSEQPSKGKTVIEKFEHYSNEVGFAVVLLTGDDRGGLHGTPAKKQMPRARQNVIFELGYFIGKIGRDKVCALYTPGVDLPSDYAGVVYVFYDENGGWKNRLASEIKTAGISIDANALIE